MRAVQQPAAREAFCKHLDARKLWLFKGSPANLKSIDQPK